jgi:3-hydroxyacyl-CoA dehydrogenase
MKAIDLGFAKAGDTVLFNARELLFRGDQGSPRNLADAGYAPPVPTRGVPVAGRTGIASMEMTLVNMKRRRHDFGPRLPCFPCRRRCPVRWRSRYGSLVDEAWLLAVERQQFVELLKTPETQARIKHMLDTGKPLRN